MAGRRQRRGRKLLGRHAEVTHEAAMQSALHHHGLIGGIGKLHHAFGVIGFRRRHGQRAAIGDEVVRILNHVVAKALPAQRAGRQLLVEGQLQGTLKQCLVGVPQTLAE